MSSNVLSSSYFPPVSWFSVTHRADSIIIDIHEHYTKQTWRNRCRIAGANGPLDLIIPVRTLGNHTPMKDVRIDYQSNWQRVHWHAIRSGYGKSAYFEYYADRFAPLFENKPEFLIDWNEKSTQILSSALKLKTTFSQSAAYLENISRQEDYRLLLAPRADKSNLAFEHKEYIQVFQEKFGFQEDLSAIDLLFCTGPDSRSYLT